MYLFISSGMYFKIKAFLSSSAALAPATHRIARPLANKHKSGSDRSGLANASAEGENGSDLRLQLRHVRTA